MKPSKPRQAGLVRLLDRLLDKGVILQADLLISLAGVPLIGVSLRAAVAAVETMLRYGIWEDWDAAVRAVARSSQASGGSDLAPLGSRAPEATGLQPVAAPLQPAAAPRQSKPEQALAPAQPRPERAAASAPWKPEQVLARFPGQAWWSRGDGGWVAGQIEVGATGIRTSAGPAVPYAGIRAMAVVNVPGPKEARRYLYLTLEDGSAMALLVQDLEVLRRLIGQHVRPEGRPPEKE